VGALLFLCFSSIGFSPSSPSLSPAIGKKVSNQKGFFFLVGDFFSYRANAKNQKDIATEKEDKKFPLFFPHLLFILFLRGED